MREDLRASCHELLAQYNGKEAAAMTQDDIQAKALLEKRVAGDKKKTAEKAPKTPAKRKLVLQGGSR